MSEVRPLQGHDKRGTTLLGLEQLRKPLERSVLRSLSGVMEQQPAVMRAR